MKYYLSLAIIALSTANLYSMHTPPRPALEVVPVVPGAPARPAAHPAAQLYPAAAAFLGRVLIFEVDHDAMNTDYDTE